MSSSAGTRLVDQLKFVNGYGPATPSSASSSYVNLSLFNHASILIDVENATTVTGSAITLTQAQDVAGTGAKALAFSVYFFNLDTVAGDTLTQGAAVSNTFTTTAVNSKSAQYVIEVDATSLDLANGFNCIKVALATGVATTIGVDFLLSGARFGGNFAQIPSAIV